MPQVKLCFDLYDRDHSGFLSADEVAQLAAALLHANMTRMHRETETSGEHDDEDMYAGSHKLLEELAAATVKAQHISRPASADPELLTLGSPRASSDELNKLALVASTSHRPKACRDYAQQLISSMDVNNDGEFHIYRPSTRPLCVDLGIPNPS